MTNYLVREDKRFDCYEVSFSFVLDDLHEGIVYDGLDDVLAGNCLKYKNEREFNIDLTNHWISNISTEIYSLRNNRFLRFSGFFAKIGYKETKKQIQIFYDFIYQQCLIDNSLDKTVFDQRLQSRLDDVKNAKESPTLLNNLAIKRELNKIYPDYHYNDYYLNEVSKVNIRECSDILINALAQVPVIIINGNIPDKLLDILRGLNCLVEDYQKPVLNTNYKILEKKLEISLTSNLEDSKEIYYLWQTNNMDDTLRTHLLYSLLVTYLNDNGGSSPIYEQIREREGWTYSVSIMRSSYLRGIVINLTTNVENTNEVIKRLDDLMFNHKIDENDFNSVKEKLIEGSILEDDDLTNTNEYLFDYYICGYELDSVRQVEVVNSISVDDAQDTLNSLKPSLILKLE